MKRGSIYQESERQRGDDYPVRAALINSLRATAKDEVVVSDFHRLGSTSDDLREALRLISGKNAVILEARTGRVSSKPLDLADMIFDGLDFYAQRGLTSERAKAMGKAGADASPATKPKTGRMPNAEAIVILNDITLSIKQAIAKINRDKRYKTKWTFNYAYRQRLAGRLPFANRVAGPKPKS